MERLVIGDCMEYHSTMPSEYVDLVLTGVPGTFDDESLSGLFGDYRRILKTGGSGYVWCDDLFSVRAAAIANGLVVRGVLILIPREWEMTVIKDWFWMYRPILYFCKGSKPSVFNSGPSEKMQAVVYSDDNVPSYSLLKHFVEVSSNEGDLVLDSFARSGHRVLEACRQTGRGYIGIEKEALWREVRRDGYLEDDRFWMPEREMVVHSPLDIKLERKKDGPSPPKQSHSFNEAIWKRNKKRS